MPSTLSDYEKFNSGDGVKFSSILNLFVDGAGAAVLNWTQADGNGNYGLFESTIGNFWSSPMQYPSNESDAKAVISELSPSKIVDGDRVDLISFNRQTRYFQKIIRRDGVWSSAENLVKIPFWSNNHFSIFGEKPAIFFTFSSSGQFDPGIRVLEKN